MKQIDFIEVGFFLGSLALTTAFATDPASPNMLAGDWVPDDPHQIDYQKLPKIPGVHVVVSDVRKEKGVNQHNYLAFNDGRFLAMWSDGPGIEDRVGQRVKFATSPDGVAWSDPEFLTPEPPDSGPDSPHYGTRTEKGMRWISRGFWQRNGELLALCSLDEAAGFFGPSLALHAFRLEPDGSWEDVGIIAEDAINNSPPKKIATGNWMMSRRPHDYKQTGVQFLVGGVRAMDDWNSFPALSTSDDLPAFTYRLCLTKDPKNSHRLAKPPTGYDRSVYLGYFDDLKAGRLSGPKELKPGRGYNRKHFDTLVRALSVTDIPNGKTDVNMNPRPLGFPFTEENRGYLEGDEVIRDQIRERIRNLTLGLIWFLQNDSEVPEDHRALANQLHFPKDEFTDDPDHFPFQLYVREGRRLVGEFTLTERNITGKGEAVTRHPDTIAVGEFPIDSFPCRKRQPGDTIVLEGYLGMLDHITRPYEIPYRIMIPKRVDGLIVPVAASTTHLAFSSIRMEPTWMALGQSAGTAAHLAIQHEVEPRAVPIQRLRELLRETGQVLSHENIATR